MFVMAKHARIIGRQSPSLIFFTLGRLKWGPVAASLLWVLHGTVGRQSDRDDAADATHSHGVGDCLLRINQQSQLWRGLRRWAHRLAPPTPVSAAQRLLQET